MEDASKLHIITELVLDEVAVVADGGHQDAKISIKRGIKPQKEENMAKMPLEILRTTMAIAMAAMPVARAMDFNAVLQKERAHELVEAMWGAFYEAMWATADAAEAAALLQKSAQQFADAVAALPAAEAAPIARSLGDVEKAIQLAQDGDVDALRTMMESMGRAPPKAAPESAPIADPVPVPAPAPATSAPTVEDPILRARLDKLEQDNIALARAVNEAEEKAALANIVRQYHGHKTGLADDSLAKLVRTCQQNGQGDVIDALIKRANAAVGTLTETRTQVNPAGGDNSGKTALAIAEEKAAVIRASNPSLTAEQCMAKVWKENPDLVARYRKGI